MAGFGDLLRSMRTARSLSQEELAQRAKITVKAVSSLERGERRRPFPHTVRSLCDALELDDQARAELVASLPRARQSPRSAPRADPDPTRPAGELHEPPAPVIGRDGDVAALEGVLTAPTRRLVTLTGPGGVGKTTIALLAAERVRAAYLGGVVVVDLADVGTPDGVVPAVAAALAAPERAAPGPEAVGTAALIGLLAGRRLLLVLDNLEHLLSWATQLAVLLRGCPDLVILVTSRAPVRLREEREVRVTPLDPEASAQLFHERLTSAGGVLDADADALVTALCAQADGLPLAVELAASAAAVFGVRGLSERLSALSGVGPRDLPTRQRSMAATLAWSHQLLTERARSLLARLSVCVGGFSLEIAEAVGTGDSAGDSAGALAALAELVEHSLVVRAGVVEGTERFRLLEPVREDAASRLAPDDRATAASALAVNVLHTARGLLDDVHGADQVAALRLLEADLGNIGVAVDALLVEGDPDAAADLLWHVHFFLAVRGHFRLGRAWAARIAESATSPLARARVLVAVSHLLSLTDPQRACERARQGLALAVQAGDDVVAADAAVSAGLTALYGADVPTAEELLAKAEHLIDGVDEPWLRTHLLMGTTQTALLAGRVAESDRLVHEADALARRVGAPSDIGSILTVRGAIAEQHGDDARAATLLREAIEMAALVENRWTITYALDSMAGIAVRAGDLVSGTRLFAASTSSAVEVINMIALDYPTATPAIRRHLDEVRAGLGDDAFERHWQGGREARLDDVTALALAVERRVHA